MRCLAFVMLSSLAAFAMGEERADAVKPAPSVDPAKQAATEESSPRNPSDSSWLSRPDVFPIAVWLQRPENASRYRKLGINLYVGLWRGPTEEQLAELRKEGMRLICGQNERSLAFRQDSLIVAWMHGDEPDNAQPLGRDKGYGPPIPAERIVEDYRRLKQRDPARPVLLNLGQGVAWDGWYGRGVRTNHPEDYPQYLEGCDIPSFDIYPAVHDNPAVAGKLWHVARGVERLRKWGGARPVWNCIECTRIDNPKVKPTPQQVKAEVWMSLIHGSQGLIYFCHQFQPQPIEAGLLADAEMAEAVGGINRQIHELAPVLRSPAASDAVTLACDPPLVSKALSDAMPARPVAVAAKRYRGDLYVFAVRMEEGDCAATFQIGEAAGDAKVEVLGESCTISMEGRAFKDHFSSYAVHLYRIHEERQNREKP